MAQVKQRTVKKSVSFTVLPSESQDEDIQSFFVRGTYISPLVLPIHLIFIIIGLFKHGLTEASLHVMFKGALLLCVVQFNYGYLFARMALLEPAGKAEKAKNGPNHFLTVIYATLVSLLLTPLVFVVLVLFGAPLYGYVKETYVLGIHLSLMFIQPLLIVFNLDFDQMYALARCPKFYKIVFTNPVLCSCFLCVLGTWLGVIPIPLDWDKPWQQWPITLLSGGYIGCVVGSVIGYVCQFL